MHGWYYLAPRDDNVETLHHIHLHHREPGYIVNRTFLVPPSLPLQYVASLLAVLTGPFFHGLFSYLSLPSDCHLDDCLQSRKAHQAMAPVAYKTCDICRKRKVSIASYTVQGGRALQGKAERIGGTGAPGLAPAKTSVSLLGLAQYMPCCSLFIPRGQRSCPLAVVKDADTDRRNASLQQSRQRARQGHLTQMRHVRIVPASRLRARMITSTKSPDGPARMSLPRTLDLYVYSLPLLRTCAGWAAADPTRFAKAAAERDGRSSDSVEPVDAHRRPADTGQRGDESWGGMGMGARIAGNGAMSTTNGTGMAHGGVSAVRSQSFGEAATPSSRPLPGDVDPSQQSLRRLSEVALRRPTEQFLTSTSPFRAPRGLAPTLLIEGEGGSAGMDHAGRGPFVPGPGQSTATVNASATAPSAPSYTAIPFGPIPNSLAPAYLLPAPPGPAQSNGLTNIDDFDFASAFHHPYDDHDHEDGAENDLAIDWPTMSSGNGTGAAGNATHPGAGVGAGGAALQMALQQDGTAQGGSGGSHPHERTTPNTHTFSTGISPSQEPGLGTLLEQPGGPGTSQLPSVTLQPPSSTTSSIPRPRIRDSDREFQIEDIVPWHTISFFITIYLGYSHSLFPMVHRPSFSQKLALRVDKRDKDFRALVLGIGMCSILQVMG